METKQKKTRNWTLISALVWALSYIVSIWVVKEMHPPQAVGLATIALMVAGFLWFLFNFIRSIAQMDEMQRRIQLEATAIAFCCCVLMIMVLGMLDLVVKLNPEDWGYRHLVPFFFLTYFVGLFWARRRYS